MSSNTPPATRAIAEFATAPRTEAPNATAVGQVLVDTVAVAVAGARTDVALRVLDWVCAEHSSGPARVWGSAVALAPSQAALVNGTMAHALDWDDAVPSMPLHPAAVMVPALLAQAARTEVDGRRLVAAYNVGSAVSRVVSQLLPVARHAAHGWHNTATTGRLATAAALAQLTGLDAERTAHALGIVTSTAAGALANFGTMTKPLHAGLAARDALMAVALAERGVTANASILEDRRGFFALYGATGPTDPAALPDRLAHWEHAWVEDWVLKRHPSCFATHRAIDAAMALHARLGVSDHIVDIEVSVPHSEGSPLLDHDPRTGLEGKFSLSYTVARTLMSGSVEMADFTDERVLDHEVRRLMAVHRVVERREGQLAPDGRHTSVAVRLADGRQLREGVDITHGDARDPLSRAELYAKATDALEAGGWPAAETGVLISRLTAAPAAASLGWVQCALGAAA